MEAISRGFEGVDFQRQYNNGDNIVCASGDYKGRLGCARLQNVKGRRLQVRELYVTPAALHCRVLADL